MVTGFAAHFAVRELSCGRRCRLGVWGELDLSTAPVLRRRLHPHLADEDLVLDLSQASFIDASGVGVIVCALVCRQEHGHSLTLRVPRGSQPQRLLALLGCPSGATVMDAKALVAWPAAQRDG